MSGWVTSRRARIEPTHRDDKVLVKEALALCAVGLLFPLFGMAANYRDFALLNPGSLPHAQWVAWLSI